MMTMTHEQLLFGKAFGECFDHIHGAMFTASAADGDRQIAACVFGVTRQPFANKALDIADQSSSISTTLRSQTMTRVDEINAQIAKLEAERTSAMDAERANVLAKMMTSSMYSSHIS